MDAAAQANLRAEVRAVEEGHRARLGDGCVLIKSDTCPGVTYHVIPKAVGHGPHRSPSLLVVCDCPYGTAHAPGTSDPTSPGDLGCKHAALVARRLEREGIAAFDGYRWIVTAGADDA